MSDIERLRKQNEALLQEVNYLKAGDGIPSLDAFGIDSRSVLIENSKQFAAKCIELEKREAFLRSALASCEKALEKIKRAALPIANQITRYDDKPNVYHCHPEITVGELRALWVAVHDLPESADAALTAARSVG